MINELAFEFWRDLRDLAMYGLCAVLPFALICGYVLLRILLRERLEARVSRLPLSKQIPIWEHDWNENGGIFRSFTRLW